MPAKYTEKERTANFWSNVNITDLLGCWEWQAYRRPDGYGSAWNGKTMILAHRFAWGLTYRPIPDKLCVLHRCDNRACCNPNHLYTGTYKDNACDREQRNPGTQPKGEANIKAKLTNNNIREIRKLHAIGLSHKAIAKNFKVNRTTIARIANHTGWTHVI